MSHVVNVASHRYSGCDSLSLFLSLLFLHCLYFCGDSTSALIVFFSSFFPTDTSSSSGDILEQEPQSPQTADENSSLRGGDDPNNAEKVCISSQDEKGEIIRSEL